MLSRFLKAANATIFGQLIARFGSFILVPIFLSRWTAAVYGEWLTLYAAVGYLASLDIGMQAAALNRLTAAYARHDIEDYRKAQSSALAMYIVTAGTGLLLLATLALAMPVGQWLGLRITPQWDSSIVLMFLGGYVLWSMPGKIIIGSYQTMGNLARSQWISNSQSIVNLLLIAGLLFFHRGMKSIAALPLMTSLGAVAFVVFDLRRNHPEIAPGLRRADWATMRSLLKPSLLFAVITVGMLLHYQALTLTVSITMGGAAVAVFVVSRTLLSVLRTATDTIADSITPDVCRLDAVQDKRKLGQLLTFVVGLSVCIGISGVAAIWWEGPSVISLWTRARLIPDVWLLRALGLVIIGEAVWVGLCVFGTATNRNRTVAICIFGSNVVAIAVAAVLIHRLGLIAVPVGLLVGEALACYHFLLRDTCHKCFVSYGRFAPKVWAFVTGTAALAIAAAYLPHLGFGDRLPVLRWAFVGMAASAVSIASTWFAWFGQNERQMLTARVSALFRPRTVPGTMPDRTLSEVSVGK